MSGRLPRAAVLLVGIAIALLAALGGIETAWAFSAFTVLVYYAITNLAALRMPAHERLYPRTLAWTGLLGCLGLAWPGMHRSGGAGLGAAGALVDAPCGQGALIAAVFCTGLARKQEDRLAAVSREELDPGSRE